MPNRIKTDEQLVSLALKDSDAFAELVSRYEAKLLRYVKRLTGLSEESAEDILQEAFLKIYRNLNDFDQSLKFSSWAYRITHNEAINHVRKNKNNNKNLSLESDKDDEMNLIEILSSEDDVESAAQKAEIKTNVREVLAQMPEDYREVLILRYLEELDYSEISNILRKPMGTVSTLISRAQKMFKQYAIKNQLEI